MVDQFFRGKNKGYFFPDKLDVGRGGVGARVVRLGVYKVVFWAFFETSLLVSRAAFAASEQPLVQPIY